jgi:hypothetical protein
MLGGVPAKILHSIRREMGTGNALLAIEPVISGLRSPLTGNVCLGEWIKTGARTYQMNHFGVSYDPTGLNLVGPARIQQWLTLDAKGTSTSGKFTIDQFDEAGNLLAHLEGKIIGTRVTMETGFQKVE